MNAGNGLPPRLRAAILDELAPVRPLRRPGLRALAAALPAAVALATAALAGARGWTRLGGASSLAWSGSLAQWLAATLLLWLALREAVPGAGLGRVRTALGVAAGLAVQLGGTLLVARGVGSVAGGLPCLERELLLGLPLFAFAAYLALLALPLRALWAGALAGAASGLLADALWHLVCPRVDLAHVLVWHFGATLVMAVAGALSGLLWGRLRSLG